MKKVFVAIAMVMGFGTMAMAQDHNTSAPAQAAAADSTTATTQTQAATPTKFVEIDAATVPAEVTNAFKAAYPNAQVAKAASATIKGVLVYQLSYKEGTDDKVAYFSADGKEIK